MVDLSAILSLSSLAASAQASVAEMNGAAMSRSEPEMSCPPSSTNTIVSASGLLSTALVIERRRSNRMKYMTQKHPGNTDRIGWITSEH